jgi:hypothetical protein
MPEQPSGSVTLVFTDICARARGGAGDALRRFGYQSSSE